MRINTLAGYTKDPPVIKKYEVWEFLTKNEIVNCFDAAMSRLEHCTQFIRDMKVLYGDRTELQKAIAFIDV